jgi:hypothetical protein
MVVGDKGMPTKITFIRSCAMDVFLVLLLASLANGQQSNKCPPTIGLKAPKYEIGQSDHTVDGSPALVLLVSIKNKHFNVEDIKALALRFKDDYCNEQRLNVLIFDNKSSAKSFTLVKENNPTYDQDQKALRGFYFLDRTTGKEYIEFSSERGNPEYRIELSNLETATNQ